MRSPWYWKDVDAVSVGKIIVWTIGLHGLWFLSSELVVNLYKNQAGCGDPDVFYEYSAYSVQLGLPQQQLWLADKSLPCRLERLMICII